MPRPDPTVDEPTRAASGPTRVTHAVLRRAPAILAWAAVVAYALLSIGGPLLGHGVFLGTDVLYRYAPWLDGGVPSGTPDNNWIGDTIDFYAPQTMVLADSVRSGDIAWWNPYIIGGTPLGALPDTGLFSPITWVWLFLPASYAAGAMKLVEMAVAVVGMALFVRRLGMSSAAQAVAGLVYISGGFMVAWTNWPHTRVAALVPLLFWATDRVLTGRRFRDAVPVALIVTAMLLTGFPAVIGYALYGLIPYAVLRMLVLRADLRAWLRAVAIGAIGAGLGALLSAWQLVPWALHATTTIDFGERAQDPSRHLDWTAAASAVAPGLIGDVGDGAQSFWISGANPVESFAYVGVAALILVAAAIALRGRDRLDRAIGWFALAGAALCTVLIFQGGWLLGLFQELPIFSNNSVTRLRFLLGFFLALAAAAGLDRVLRRADRRPMPADERPRRVPPVVATVARGALAVALCVALVLVVLDAYRIIPEEVTAQQGAVLRHLALAALVVAAVLVLAVLVRRRWVTIGAVAAVAVLLLAQGVTVTRSWWPVSDSFYAATPTHDYLAENLGHERYLGVDWTMLTGTNNAYQLRSVTGHGFHTPEWKELLRSVDEDAMLTRTYSQLPWEAAGSPVLDRMGVRYVVQSPDAVPPGEPESVGVPATLDPQSGPVTSTAVTGPIRAVQVVLTEQVDGEDARIVVRVVDQDGATVAESGRVAPEAGVPVWVAVPAEDIGATESVRVRLDVEGADGFTVPVDPAGDWATAVLRPADDDLTVVHGGDAVIYQRENAAPRIRWADDNRVIEDEDERVAAIGSGDIPTSTVILEDAADEQSLTGDSTADLTVLSDGDTIRTRVEADGDGWLVLAESVRGGSGWSATLDGEPVPLVDADEAMGAVYVPDGSHEVAISYHPPGLRAGMVGSATAAVALLGLAVVPVVWDRRRRREVAA